MIQEYVQEYTRLRHAEDKRNGLSPDAAQVVVDEYDPVVALALISVDHRVSIENRIRCLTEVAQYTRPKLRSIEVTTDPELPETLEHRRMLSERLVGLLEGAASAKKSGG